MRLLTRSDFDGLICAVLLKEVGVIDNFSFVHPKDLQDNKVEVTKDDCLANVPFVEGVGLWFDHHSSEYHRSAFNGKYIGASVLEKSCARVIYNYYGGKEKFPKYDEMMLAVDAVDSGELTKEQIEDPTGWILLGFLMDPRTGLGRFRDFTISNYHLMENLIEACRYKQIDEILSNPDVKERIELYFEQEKLFREMLYNHTKIKGNTIITDLRGQQTIYAGNRFLIYSLFSDQNLSVWIVSGRGGEGCSAAVGYSILNKTSRLDVGELMRDYGGGGHKQVGTCQFSNEEMQEKLAKLLADIESING